MPFSNQKPRDLILHSLAPTTLHTYRLALRPFSLLSIDSLGEQQQNKKEEEQVHSRLAPKRNEKKETFNYTRLMRKLQLQYDVLRMSKRTDGRSDGFHFTIRFIYFLSATYFLQLLLVHFFLLLKGCKKKKLSKEKGKTTTKEKKKE